MVSWICKVDCLISLVRISGEDFAKFENSEDKLQNSSSTNLKNPQFCSFDKKLHKILYKISTRTHPSINFSYTHGTWGLIRRFQALLQIFNSEVPKLFHFFQIWGNLILLFLGTHNKNIHCSVHTKYFSVAPSQRIRANFPGGISKLLMRNVLFFRLRGVVYQD